ncbi:unnamed protein product [Tilletia controversa]|nr:unnamed protein product [Tilletia controversa]
MSFTHSTTTSISNNGPSVDRSAALAELQSTYGMSGQGYRVPSCFAGTSPSSDKEIDDKSFMTSSTSSSSSSASSASSSSSAFSLKAKATAFLKFNGGRKTKVTVKNNDSTSTIVDQPVSAVQSKPDPQLVFAHLSSQYGIGASGGGYKLHNFEAGEKKSKKSNGGIAAPAPDSPEAILAALMDQYGAPGRGQVRAFI